MTEQQIQTGIKKKLQDAGWYVTKLILTSTPGIPDLLALKNGKALFIECKRPGLKPSPLQEHVMGKLRAAGFDVFVVDDVKKFCLGDFS
jgi:Holliday junction resolvase